MSKGARWAALLYVAIVVAVALFKFGDHERPKKGGPMNWAETKDGIQVNAKPAGTWTWAYDYVKGPALIQLEATGRWSYSPSKECSADGDLSSLIASQNILLPGAPVGALLAKIGGSTAGAKDGKVVLVGSRCLLEIDEKTSGPIFLTINDELTGLSDNDGTLTVKISITPLSASPPAGESTPAAP